MPKPPEPFKLLGDHSIVIRPDEPERRMTWPNPSATTDARWRVYHAPDALTRDDVLALARAAGAYQAVFERSVARWTAIHTTIRRAIVEHQRASWKEPRA